MDKVNVFYEENKPVIMSTVHVVAIVLIVLAMNPQYVPMFVPINVVMYAVYVLLAVGLVTQGYSLAMYIKEKVAPKTVTFDAVIKEEESQ